jgi:hypothetical protein
MPLYEYISESDGEVITLLRPMREADSPVEDPAGKGRRFVRRHSTFGVGGSASAATAGGSLPGGLSLGGCCPCGKSAGSCGGGFGS